MLTFRFVLIAILTSSAGLAYGQPPTEETEEEVAEDYCYIDNSNNDCTDVIFSYYVEGKYPNGVLACGGCPPPTPQVPNPVCGNGGKDLPVGTQGNSIVFAYPANEVQEFGTAGKKSVIDGDPVDCGELRKCNSDCVAVLVNNVQQYNCKEQFVSSSLIVHERVADGDDCLGESLYGL